MIIVSDTTPISELAKVDHLDLLPKLFGKVVIPQGVFDELQVGEHPAAKLVQDLPWLEVVMVDNQQLVRELQQSFKLDLGESEAIALAEEISASGLLIDERAARKVAMARKLPLIGTVGILLLGKRRGLLDSVKDVLDEMQAQGMRISERLYVQVLTLAQEKDGE
ncbi:MAG: nucleic acid-binding protein [Anabaena sp. CRKS33]|jgi:predicted nucleic acid-binding protein|nr:MAG: nucleic acid-binding protein [Anabaena sp. CRKS33]